SPDSPREPAEITDPKRAAGGWIPRMGAPKGLPAWLTQADLDYYVNEFTGSGFRGGINFYRNFHRNWETTPELTDRKISQPTAFIAGQRDGGIRGASAHPLSAPCPRGERRTAHGDHEPGRHRFPWRDAHPRRGPLGAAGEARGDQRGAVGVSY